MGKTKFNRKVEEKTLKAGSLIRVRNLSGAHAKFKRAHIYLRPCLIEYTTRKVGYITYMRRQHLISGTNLALGYVNDCFGGS